MPKKFYDTKEMTAHCNHCRFYVALCGCGQNKNPAECIKKKYETKSKLEAK